MPEILDFSKKNTPNQPNNSNLFTPDKVLSPQQAFQMLMQDVQGLAYGQNFLSQFIMVIVQHHNHLVEEHNALRSSYNSLCDKFDSPELKIDDSKHQLSIEVEDTVAETNAQVV